MSYRWEVAMRRVLDEIRDELDIAASLLKSTDPGTSMFSRISGHRDALERVIESIRREMAEAQKEGRA